MERFVRTVEGVNISFNEITEYHRVRGAKNRIRICDRHDRYHEVEGEQWTKFVQSTRYVVPAEPGTYVIPVYDDESILTMKDYEKSYLTQVLGWVLDFEGCIYPLTAEGVEREDAILRPDGSVVLTFIGTWPNSAAYLEYQQENVRARIARDKAAAEAKVAAEATEAKSAAE